MVGRWKITRAHLQQTRSKIHRLQPQHDISIYSKDSVIMTTIKQKATQVVSRHTRHGTDKSNARELKVIASIGTERSYVQALSNYLRWCDFNNVHPDYTSNICVLKEYLEERSEWIKQKTLDQERQALQLVFKQKLPCLRSQKISILDKRSYTFAQVKEILIHQNDKNSLTTHLALYGGLRAHEPATILPLEERAPSSHRSWDDRRFLGTPQHRLYSVVGKGGLIRAVAIPLWLACKLEELRVQPRQVTDRGIFYTSHYDVGFGQAWSQSFTSASKRALGYSTGAHGLRHSYAKWRLDMLIKELELINPKWSPAQINQDALLILSQELGHFRLDIVFAYLR